MVLGGAIAEYPCVPDLRGREWRDIVVIPVIGSQTLNDAYTDALTASPLSKNGACVLCVVCCVLFVVCVCVACACLFVQV